MYVGRARVEIRVRRRNKAKRMPSGKQLFQERVLRIISIYRFVNIADGRAINKSTGARVRQPRVLGIAMGPRLFVETSGFSRRHDFPIRSMSGRRTAVVAVASACTFERAPTFEAMARPVARYERSRAS